MDNEHEGFGNEWKRHDADEHYYRPVHEAGEPDEHQLILHKIFNKGEDWRRPTPSGHHPYQPQGTQNVKVEPDVNHKEEKVYLKEVPPPEITLSIDHVHRFKASARDIIDAVVRGDTIDGIKIVDEVQNPNFRFETSIDPDLGSSLSQAFAAVLTKARSLAGKKGATKTNEMRGKSANEYAINMHKLITDLKSETGISTYKATAELLTKRGVETPNGGKWHISTIQDLEKRWKYLGLMPSKSDPK